MIYSSIPWEICCVFVFIRLALPDSFECILFDGHADCPFQQICIWIYIVVGSFIALCSFMQQERVISLKILCSSNSISAGKSSDDSLVACSIYPF